MMLDWVGDEVVCVISIVCYELGVGYFGYVYEGGEEIFVLFGIFSDEYGDYLVGSYLCNLFGSVYIFYFVDGCIIFVKLW